MTKYWEISCYVMKYQKIPYNMMKYHTTARYKQQKQVISTEMKTHVNLP